MTALYDAIEERLGICAGATTGKKVLIVISAGRAPLSAEFSGSRMGTAITSMPWP